MKNQKIKLLKETIKTLETKINQIENQYPFGLDENDSIYKAWYDLKDDLFDADKSLENLSYSISMN